MRRSISRRDDCCYNRMARRLAFSGYGSGGEVIARSRRCLHSVMGSIVTAYGRFDEHGDGMRCSRHEAYV